jgi:hypothetical protein
MALTKIALDSNRDDHYVYIDKTAIKAIQVQLPAVTTLIAIQGDGAVGVVRLFLNGLTAPFQFTRTTADEVWDVVKQLVD